MKNTIVFPRLVNSSNFYSEALKQARQITETGNLKQITFDFGNVEIINPLAVPKLLTLAAHFKDVFGVIPRLYIPWTSKLVLLYLDNIGFFEIVKNYNPFSVDDVGDDYRDYAGQRIVNKDCRVYVFDSTYNRTSVSDTLLTSRRIIGKVHNTSYVIKKERNISENDYKAREIATGFIELVINAIEHSEGKLCFAIFQTTGFKDRKMVHIAVSDTGIGFYNTIARKVAIEIENNLHIWDKDIFLNAGDYSNVYGMLEACFWRLESQIQGIYDIMKSVVLQNGTFRIQCMDKKIILDRAEETCFSEKGDAKFREIFNDVKKFWEDYNIKVGYEEIPNIQIDIREQQRFKGVHVELEIPYNV